MAIPWMPAFGGLSKITRSFSHCDAVFDPTVCDPLNNADLTLILNVGLQQVNPAGGAATGSFNDSDSNPVPIKRWTNGAWNHWKKNFRETAQRFWHGRFWLVNNFPSYLVQLHHGILYRHNVWCRFRLNVSDALPGGSYHHTIQVVRVDPSSSFRSHWTLYSTNDTRFETLGYDSKGKAIQQKSHVHEIGHLLGMDHSSVGHFSCLPSGDTNQTACYGVNDRDKYSVMGTGMRRYPEHAYPWRKAMADISGAGTVRELPTVRLAKEVAGALAAISGTTPGPVPAMDWEPKQKRHYPRTWDEAQRGIAITKRPTRNMGP